MDIDVAWIRLRYDGAIYRVDARLHPHGAHDVGVAPAQSRSTAIPEEDDRGADLAEGIGDALREHALWLERQLAGGWGVTSMRPLF